MSGGSILRIQELEFSIRDEVHVGPVSIALDAGSFLGVVGESGSGKSLLCRTLIGMLGSVGGQVDGGSLLYGEVDYTRATRREWTRIRREKIGYMPQASMSSLNPVRRVGSQMSELMMGSKQSKRDLSIDLLRQVQMRDPDTVLKSYPHELSGGMRQRVMLALALIGDPQILIADEPTTALDATVQAEILALIAHIQKERGMAVVLVSHDMRVVRRSCTDVMVMYRGRVMEQGAVAEVLQTPKHPYTKALLSADPALSPRKTMLGTIDEDEMRMLWEERA